MKLRKWLVLSAVAVIALGIVLIRHTPAQSQTALPKQPSQRLGEKALTARTGNEVSMRVLADEVFSQPYGFPRLPAPIEDPIRERLVRAEIAYRHGRGQSVHERDIVRLVNTFGSRFGVPDYVKTNERQVRFTRLHAAFVSPVFMGEGMTNAVMSVGQSINPTMSPLQAAHLTMTLIQQKLINPDFQLAPPDWEAHEHQKALARWQTHQMARALGREVREESQVVTYANPKRQEIADTLVRSTAATTMSDALSLAHEALDTLGIAR